METDQVRFERRPMQRFALHLPVSVRLADGGGESSGFTQDLSVRGILFYTDLPLTKAEAIELTFVMPSEITLAEAMRVRCRGIVVRVTPPAGGARRGVAVRIEEYEFLPELESLVRGSGSFLTTAPALVDSAAESKPRMPAPGFRPSAPVLP